jgi:hypothetical protein
LRQFLRVAIGLAVAFGRLHARRLAHAASYTSASGDELTRHLRVVATHHQHLAVWEENYPENFGSCAALVAAEIARIEGRELDAERLLDWHQTLRNVSGTTGKEAA